MKKSIIVLGLLVIMAAIVGCTDAQMMWYYERSDDCNSDNPQKCRLWNSWANGNKTVEEIRIEVYGPPTVTPHPPTPIPPPVHRPVKKVIETPTPITGYSPVFPTPTPTPTSIYVVPEYGTLLNWYFK